MTGELADLAESAMRDATAVIRNGERALRRVNGHPRGQLRRALNDPDTILTRSE